jgi:GAF domain-containing protein/anti-sigma regulatory factor (Ser/Thr protein kinase)
MRRGQSKAKGKGGARTRTGSTKTNPRIRRKGELQAEISRKAAGKARELNKTAHRKASANRDEDIAALRQALAEAHQREAATADVLKIIARSGFDLQGVLDTLAESAGHLCAADSVGIRLARGGTYHRVASYGLTPEQHDYFSHHPLRPDRSTILGRVVIEGRIIQVEDSSSDAEFVWADPPGLQMARTILGVPMLRDGTSVGAFILVRTIVRPFTPSEIELVATFANQAVIAIENARLFDEVQARTKELAESLAQQTATSEVLQVISSSLGELEPVFQAMLENATRICEANFGVLNLWVNGALRMGAMHNVPSAFAEFLHGQREAYQPIPGSLLDRVIRTKQVSHIADQAAESVPGRTATLGGARSIVCVPMLNGDLLIGTISIYRQEVRPFTDKQIQLVENFARQAVIAIDNARLLNELRESLQQQTATADVLKVISRSTFDLQKVLDTLIESIALLCEADTAAMVRPKGDILVFAAGYGAPADIIEMSKQTRWVRGRGTISGRALLEGRPVQVEDVQADPEFTLTEYSKAVGFHTVLAVPLLRHDETIGVIGLTRREVRRFTDKQIELASTFADQAVIAIENARLFDQVQARTRELTESLEQQTATSEVLRVIGTSQGELEPIFETMLANATRICEARFGGLFQAEGDCFRAVAVHGDPAYVRFWRENPLQVADHPSVPLARLARTKQIIHIPDLAVDEAYIARNPRVVALVDSGGARTLLLVPMLKENELVGAIGIYRQEMRPFTEKQIELVTNFAAQAVIAIENARLLNELRESLQQQTATGDVLKVISRATFDLQRVLEILIESATRLCAATQGFIFRLDGEVYRLAADYNAPPRFRDWRYRRGIRPGEGSVVGRVAVENQTIQILDAQADVDWRTANAEAPGISSVRTLLGVPMRREGVLIGVIAMWRTEVRAFTEKQLAVVETFADQAVIAIENVRLLAELRESLDRQTATSEVLQVISGSPGDLQPVFASMLTNATRVCEAKFGTLYLCEDDGFRAVAIYNAPPAYAQSRAAIVHPHRDSSLRRAAETKQVVQVADVTKLPGYLAGDPFLVTAVAHGGYRTVLSVPMVKENDLVGVICVYRQEVRPFTDKQIELLTNFARQAVIAIENVRLLNELRSRTADLARSVEELRALGDVSQAVNSTLDLATVLSTIVSRAVQLSGTEAGTIYEFDNQQKELLLRSTYGMSEELIEAIRDQHLGVGEPVMHRAVACREPVQIPDLQAIPATPAQDIIARAGYRALLVVPLLGRDHVVGALVVRRKAPGEFPQNIIDLLKTFAAQSVLAIQNAHLFTEIDEKSRQLEIASQHKSQFLANMSHELRTPLNAILGYTELILDNIYGETPEKMREVLDRLQANGKHLLGLINDVLDLSKIEAGQLTFSLADYSLKDVVYTVFTAVESLATGKRLALTTDVAPNLPIGHGDERRLAQVLLNLVGNAIKFTDKGEVAIKATTSDGSFTVAVTDTGPGIAPSDQGKIFEEFQQADNSATKRKGGTGLGLSIAKRIIEMHGGRLWVESDVGKGSTFAFSIPVHVNRPVTSHEQVHPGS